MISQRLNANLSAVFSAAVAGIVLAILAGGPSSAADDSATIETIVTKWKEREAKAKTIAFEISFRQTTAAGATLSGPEEPLKRSEKEFVSDGTRKVWFDGEKMRDVLSHIAWRSDQNAYLPIEQTEVFDGAQGSSFYQGPGLLKGFISQPNGQNTYRGNLMLAPFMKQYRGFATSVAAFRTDEWKLAKPETVDGRECIVVEEKRSMPEQVGPRHQKYWIDPARDWYIVRNESYSNDAVSNRLTIAYAEDREWGWLPKSWRTESFRRTKPLMTTDVTLKSVKFNVEVDPATFELEFPPGTTVSSAGVGMFVVPAATKP